MNFFVRPLGLQPLERKSQDGDIFFESTVANQASSFDFPSTRFYGSKRKQMSWLESELREVVGKTALDAFGGTGAVSFLLGRLGWSVTYNDIFEFNAISARAIFSSNDESLTNEELADFLHDVKPFEGFVANNFAGLYFTDQENQWLDGAMRSIAKFSGKKRDILLYLLFQACLKKRPFNLFHRANLQLRHSVVPVKFGNRTTWNKSFDSHISVAHAELRKMHYSHRCEVRVNAPTCARRVDGVFDLIYVDPPYFKKKKAHTDSYLQRYHFLEGLARFDEWESLIDPCSPIKSIMSPYRDEVISKKNLISDLEVLRRRHPLSNFAMSYVSDEDPSEQELHDFFKRNFDKVKLSRRSFNKALSSKKTFELLLIGR